MPKMFRTMHGNAERPECGSDSCQLGVRVPPHPKPDITPDSDGFVSPRSGGMSVFSAIKKMPARLIPNRLREVGYKNALGDDELNIYCTGEGKFVEGDFHGNLVISINNNKKKHHGVIEPSKQMTIHQLQSELHATADLWQVCEDGLPGVGQVNASVTSRDQDKEGG